MNCVKMLETTLRLQRLYKKTEQQLETFFIDGNQSKSLETQINSDGDHPIKSTIQPDIKIVPKDGGDYKATAASCSPPPPGRFMKINKRIKSIQNKYKCKYCNVKFETKKELAKHMLAGEAKYVPELTKRTAKQEVCNDCGRKVRSEKGQEVLLKCKECGKYFRSKKNFGAHATTHLNSKKIFKCNVCCKKFYHASIMILHDVMLHSRGEEMLTLQCKFCKKTYKSDVLFLKHMREYHLIF